MEPAFDGRQSVLIAGPCFISQAGLSRILPQVFEKSLVSV